MSDTRDTANTQNRSVSKNLPCSSWTRIWKEIEAGEPYDWFFWSKECFCFSCLFWGRLASCFIILRDLIGPPAPKVKSHVILFISSSFFCSTKSRRMLKRHSTNIHHPQRPLYRWEFSLHLLENCRFSCTLLYAEHPCFVFVVVKLLSRCGVSGCFTI